MIKLKFGVFLQFYYLQHMQMEHLKILLICVQNTTTHKYIR